MQTGDHSVGMRRLVLTAAFLAAIALSSRVAPALAVQDGDLAPIRRLHEFKFGPDRSVLDSVAATVRAAMPSAERRKAVASALVEVAVSSAAFDARQFACRQLVYVASQEHVPMMARLLREDAMAHYALMVLARVPGPGVAEALRAALPGLEGPALLGAMDLVGERGDASAVALLRERLVSTDDAVATCAANALARIGGPEADAALLRGFARAGRARKALLADALLMRGETARASAQKATARRLYASVAESPAGSRKRCGTTCLGARGEVGRAGQHGGFAGAHAARQGRYRGAGVGAPSSGREEESIASGGAGRSPRRLRCPGRRPIPV
jgi:hypothetical protein